MTSELKSQALRSFPNANGQIQSMESIQGTFQLGILCFIPCSREEFDTNNSIDGYPIIKKQTLYRRLSLSKQMGNPC